MTTPTLRPLPRVRAAQALLLLAAAHASACYSAPDERVGAPDGLQPPTLGDVIPPAPIADAPPVAEWVDREAVALSWPIDGDEADLDERPSPHRATSRAYWEVVSAADLAQGVPLTVSEPGALVKLNARGGGAIVDVRVVDVDGVEHAGDDALEPLAPADHLVEVGAPFPAGTALYTLDPELGAGVFTLHAAADDDVLVYVLERDSAVDLSLEPSTSIAFAGDALAVRADLRDGDAPLLATFRGEGIAPGGARTPLTLARAAGSQAIGELRLPRTDDAPGALYSVQVDAAGTTRSGLAVRRSVLHAIAVGLPTARFTGDATPVRTTDGGVQVHLGVEVGAASRYGVSAVLYGDHSGVMRPIAAAQAAGWFDAGAGELRLDFDRAALIRGAGTTLELRDLRLVDQGRVQVLHRQARALAW